MTMIRFLRAMISHPGESCEEREVIACIKAEMEKQAMTGSRWMVWP